MIRETGRRVNGRLDVDAATIGLLDLHTGEYRRLLDVASARGGYQGMPGHMAAFSPDGVTGGHPDRRPDHRTDPRRRPRQQLRPDP
ncbi:hypothetical protein [Plantactinospora sp. B5E13]|uniref:hypothetical protein n=1 Tax=unclassified Plantactinospora TaxID=2631981 RepID=UPI00325CAACB